MKKGKQLTAGTLRLILSLSLFVITGLTVVGFSFVADMLKTTASDASRTLAEANASQNNVQVLQQIQTKLSQNKEVVDRASGIVAESQSYQYQDQIIKDLTDYATRSSISITNIDFAPTKSAGTSTPAGSSGTQTTPSAAPTGVNSTLVSVTIKNPVDYNSLLRFIHSTEQNLTKMQISRIGLSKEASGGISSDALTIEVYVR